MRTPLLIALVVSLLLLPAIAETDEPPFPREPEIWVGTWDLESTFTEDKHEMTVSMSDEQPSDGWTQFDISLESYPYGNSYGEGELIGLCYGDEGRLNVGFWEHDGDGGRIWHSEFILDAFDLEGPMARYWGPSPNEQGVATMR